MDILREAIVSRKSALKQIYRWPKHFIPKGISTREIIQILTRIIIYLSGNVIAFNEAINFCDISTCYVNDDVEEFKCKNRCYDIEKKKCSIIHCIRQKCNSLQNMREHIYLKIFNTNSWLTRTKQTEIPLIDSSEIKRSRYGRRYRSAGDASSLRGQSDERSRIRQSLRGGRQGVEMAETLARGRCQAYRSRRTAQLFAAPQVRRYPWQRSFEDPSRLTRPRICITRDMFCISLTEGKPHYLAEKKTKRIDPHDQLTRRWCGNDSFNVYHANVMFFYWRLSSDKHGRIDNSLFFSFISKRRDKLN